MTRLLNNVTGLGAANHGAQGSPHLSARGREAAPSLDGLPADEGRARDSGARCLRNELKK